jgi:hypothetical protein
MTGDARRSVIERGVGGRRNAVRAEQLRAAGLSYRAIARALSVPVPAVARLFELQDDLALSDVDGVA